ncbi:Rad50 zinc hook motif [Musa troglodytarum]|uniref:DNA repair protein RAD50 n=1 Tax=Musa troglodytarum TaxID=320322 RepID=A0A9E7HC77_9LILI|nr:Rad50 zinc hook motif [Musa troglodytarum]
MAGGSSSSMDGAAPSLFEFRDANRQCVFISSMLPSSRGNKQPKPSRRRQSKRWRGGEGKRDRQAKEKGRLEREGKGKMSTVDKMLIKGIRSFSPENKHVITFFRPLTLIVGPNGAGKTTIIECLKLSCTGELPPNSRSGHSFIHDPKVAGETETKGQIKLRFKTAAGKDVVCIRSFQLTQKASKMEFKAIESVLQTINPHSGEKVCLSYRCADMDREIPALMGVSKAILENVIFVHQDESNWPLQDPSTLKKNYTKALEAIKKLHKEQAQEIKTYKLKLENLQTLKDAAYKLRENIAQDQEKSEFLKAQIKELEGNIEGIENKILHAETTLKELRKLQDQISTRTTARSTLYKLQQTQYAALAEENEDSDEELKEWQMKFEERIALLETKISKLEREMNDEETKSSLLLQTINDTTREIGKLQAEADAHMSLRCERDSTIQRIFTKYNLGSLPSAPFSNDVALNLTNRTKTRLLDVEKELQDKKKSNEMELKFLWERYVTANARCSEVESQKQAKSETKLGISKRMKEKANERDLADHELSNLNLSHIDERERSFQIEVERKTLLLGEKDYEATINQKRTEMFSLDQKIKALYREKDILASDSEDRVKLDMKKEEFESCKRKQKKLQVLYSFFFFLMEEYKEKIRGVLKGRVPSDKDLKKETTHAFGLSLKKEYDDLNSKTLEAEKEVKLAQMKIQDAKNHILKLQKDVDVYTYQFQVNWYSIAKRRFLDSKLQALIQAPADIGSFTKVLLEAMEKKDVQKSKYNIADGMRQMFDPFERVARAHHICPCCERPFSPDEEDEFVKKQRVKSASSAEHMKLLAVESSNADTHFQQLDKLRMIYEEYVKLGKEAIPLAEKNLKELTEDLSQRSQAFDDLVGVLAHVKTEKDAVEVLLQPVETIDRLWQEMENLKPQIEDLEYKLDSRGQGVRSMEEIQFQLNSLQSKRESLSTEIENLREEQKFLNADLSSIQMRWHSLREEKLKASSILHKVKKADEDLVLLAEENAQVDLDEKHLAEALVPLIKEKEKLLQDHANLKLKLEREYDNQAESKRSFQQDIEMLMTLSSRIKEYLDSKKVEKFKDLQEKHTSFESQLQKCETKKQEISADLNKSKELLRNQDQLKRNIDDNLNYRKTKAEVDELTFEIESLEEKVLNIGSMSSLEADLKRHLQEKERLLSELNRCHGTLSVYQSNISKYKLDLKQAQYNDIDRRYFNQLIQLKTTEMANKDLDRYYSALDKALMRFHTMKMEEINMIIKELWQQTYRGQDIDYISIHSDSEGTGTRSYSYRVLMQTGDAELEMRGRCSAGQKVLASLIIRLALAETFCLNCGILALDEPTTNLDGPNAESLAAALLRIMEDRKGQENFQLIVITHDERFAQLIGQRQHAEKYYRVTKDELQHSIIEAQEIFD